MRKREEKGGRKESNVQELQDLQERKKEKVFKRHFTYIRTHAYMSDFKQAKKKVQQFAMILNQCVSYSSMLYSYLSVSLTLSHFLFFSFLISFSFFPI